MVRADAITGIEAVGSRSEACSTCHKGKQTQSMIPHATQDRATEVLRQVFSNICGPIENPPIEGYWYFITFTNDFSWYTHVGLCKSKDDAFPIFKWWRACTEKETGKTLKILHTDGGGEYTSNAFSTYLADNGIKCKLTNAYTLQENGVSERANHTLNNLAWSMIADVKEVLQNKSLPPSLWSHAVRHAAWIKNWVFTHSLNSDITLYQAYFQRKPSLATLRLFGCKAYAHIPKVDQSKFMERTIECMHIGFAEEKRAYLLYSWEKRCLFELRDVEFEEIEGQERVTVDLASNDDSFIDPLSTEN